MFLLISEFHDMCFRNYMLSHDLLDTLDPKNSTNICLDPRSQQRPAQAQERAALGWEVAAHARGEAKFLGRNLGRKKPKWWSERKNDKYSKHVLWLQTKNMISKSLEMNHAQCFCGRLTAWIFINFRRGYVKSGKLQERWLMNGSMQRSQ